MDNVVILTSSDSDSDFSDGSENEEEEIHESEEFMNYVNKKDYDPSKIMVIIFVILFMFVFSKGIEVLTKTNSYSIPYDGPAKSAFEKWLPFTKGD